MRAPSINPLHPAKWAIALLNATLLGSWLLLFRPVYLYLTIIFSRQEFRTNQIVLLGVLLLIVVQIRKRALQIDLLTLPQWHLPALSLVAGGSLSFLLVERYLDVNTFSASLFGLATYGLLGLWMSPPAWRRGLPAALLLIGALPFGEHLQTFVGYPVRILTAAIVRQGLAALGVHTVGIDTILVFESGISKIDLPCSGVKSLWTGGLFWLAATWIEGRTIRLRWLLAGAGFALLLLLANLVRVAVLVGVGPVAGANLLAEMLHVPLGVLGFVGACTAAVALLRRIPAASEPPEYSRVIAPDSLPRPFWLVPLLGSTFLGMALLYTPRPQVVLAESGPAWQFPAGLAAEPWPLTAGERRWLADSGVDHADRYHFQWEGYSGSLLLVTGNTWRAHHRPESCFQVYGLTVERTYTHLVAPDFPIRLLALSTQGGVGRLSAAYWLQSASLTTDDYATRIWADLVPHPQRWVLVTILFDQPVNPAADETQGLYQALHKAIGENLQKGTTQ